MYFKSTERDHLVVEDVFIGCSKPSLYLYVIDVPVSVESSLGSDTLQPFEGVYFNRGLESSLVPPSFVYRFVHL